MTEFDKLQWANSQFSRNYRDEADIYLPFRGLFFQITLSLYSCFISKKHKARILDIGCGDGLFIQELLKSFTPASVTLVDGSSEMLKAAKERLGNNKKFNFINASFQDLFAGDLLKDRFDFIYSSLAIHHLTFDEKKRLYNYIYSILSPNGYFANYDIILPSTEKQEQLYLKLWKEWIKGHPLKKNEEMENIPELSKDNPDDIPDTLESQIDILKEIGFKSVDCYFKYSVFSLFGGFK